DSEYIAVIAREFPDRLRKMPAEQFQKILRPIGEGQFNTLSAAYSVRALKVYSQTIANNPPELSISALRRDKAETELVSGKKALLRTSYPADSSAVRFSGVGRPPGPGVFFQVVDSGFDKQVPQTAVADGLEIYRELLRRDSPA